METPGNEAKQQNEIQREPPGTQIFLDDQNIVGRGLGLAGDHQGGPITLVVGSERVTVSRSEFLKAVSLYANNIGTTR